MTLSNCPHQLWFILPLNASQWSGYSKFTLRVSWSAAYPASFQLDVYDPNELMHYFNVSPSRVSETTKSREKYARIRVLSNGLPNPSYFTPEQLANISSKPLPVPFIVILEPLILGVLPQMLLPFVLWLVSALLVGGVWYVPWLLRFLGRAAEEARREKELAEKEKKE
jgi:hypothetical protein